MIHRDTRRILCLMALLSLVTSLGFNRLAGGSRQGAMLKAMTANMGGTREMRLSGELSDERLMEVLRGQVRPDLLILQECDEKRAELLARILDLPFVVHAKELGGKASLALVSKYPFRSPRFLDFQSGKGGHGALAAYAEIHGQRLLVASVHLDRIHDILDRGRMPEISLRKGVRAIGRELLRENLRSRQAAVLMEWLDVKSREPVLIGGDFNTLPLSRAYRVMGRYLEDAFWPSLDFFAPTYRALAWPVQPRIDYLFHSPDMACVERGVIQESPGDHYPVWGRLIMVN